MKRLPDPSSSRLDNHQSWPRSLPPGKVRLSEFGKEHIRRPPVFLCYRIGGNFIDTTLNAMLKKLKIWARELKAQLLTLWFSRTHPDTPIIAKIMAAVVVAYAFSPIDLIPDFVPVIGYLDDLIIVPIGIYITLRLIPEHVVEASRIQADAWLTQKRAKPRNYFVAAFIVLVWAAVAYWAWTAFAD